jgi:hypothetical protein
MHRLTRFVGQVALLPTILLSYRFVARPLPYEHVALCRPKMPGRADSDYRSNMLTLLANWGDLLLMASVGQEFRDTPCVQPVPACAKS